MEPLETLTAEQYGWFLIDAIKDNDDPEIKQELQEHYELLIKELTYLERCLNADPYEAQRSL